MQPPMNSFDLVIIGSGPGGYRAAVLAALRGLKVAIVEKGEWGRLLPEPRLRAEEGLVSQRAAARRQPGL